MYSAYLTCVSGRTYDPSVGQGPRQEGTIVMTGVIESAGDGGLAAEWLISVDDHVIEPPNVWQDRLPAKFKAAGPAAADRREGRGLVLRGQANPDAGAVRGRGPHQGGVQPPAAGLRRHAAWLLRLRCPGGRHGPGAHPRLAVLPVLPPAVRADVLRGQGQGTRRAVRARLQRLHDRRVVRQRARPLHPAGHRPAVGPAAGRGRNPALRRAWREGGVVQRESGAARPAVAAPRPGPVLGPGLRSGLRVRACRCAPTSDRPRRW